MPRTVRSRAWRILRNTAAVLLVLLVIGVITFAIDVHVADPLDDGEQVVVPARTRDAEGRWRVGRNWLGKDTFGLYEAYIAGGDLERGLAYGALAREPIERQERLFTDRIHALVPGTAKLTALKYFVAWFDRDLDEHVPREYQREIFGVSRSFSDAFDAVGPKFHRALNYHAAHDIGHALQDLALVGCTSFSAWGDRTADGGALVGRTFDFYLGEDFAREKLITFIDPEGGIPHVLVGWGGFMGAASAMNLEGLTVTINAARSALPTSARTPISLLARMIVEHAATIDEAVAIAQAHAVFVSESILVHSARDGRAVVIEKAPDGMDVFAPKDGLVVCANHYQSARFKDSEANVANLNGSDSPARTARMHALLDTAHALDPATAVRILRDRQGPDGADIGKGNPSAINQLIAHHAVVFQPDKRLMWVSTWPYQLGAFVCYDLNNVFARCRADSLHGPVYEADRTIAADPFAASPEMTRFAAYRVMRNAIYDHLISGMPVSFTAQQEVAFLSAEPACYLTSVTLGDLRRAQGDPGAAAFFYQRALRAPAVPPAERARIQRLLDACAKP